LLGLYGASGPYSATASPYSLPVRPRAHENRADQTERYEWQSSAVTSARHDFLRQHFPNTKTGFLVPGVAMGNGITSLDKLRTREKQLFSSIGTVKIDCDSELNCTHHWQVGET
jgi:hypothetical protein